MINTSTLPKRVIRLQNVAYKATERDVKEAIERRGYKLDFVDIPLENTRNRGGWRKPLGYAKLHFADSMTAYRAYTALNERGALYFHQRPTWMIWE